MKNLADDAFISFVLRATWPHAADVDLVECCMFFRDVKNPKASPER